MGSTFCCGGRRTEDNYIVSVTRPLKILLVGDSGTGKTKLVKRFIEGTYCPEMEAETNLVKIYNTTVGGKSVSKESIPIFIYDAPATKDDSMYSQANVVLLCFDLCNKKTLANIESKWLPALKSAKCAKNYQFLLVGTKKDERERQSKRESRRGREGSTVTREMGMNFHREIKSCVYLECSAQSNEQVEQVFKTASLLAYGRRELSKFWFISFKKWNKSKN